MYEDLIKRLRTHNGWALNKTLDEAADAIKELQDRIAASEATIKRQSNIIQVKDRDLHRAIDAKSQWIPVTERLPEKDIEVLVFAEGKIEGFFGDTVIAISKRYDFNIFTDSEGVEVWQSPWQYFLTDYEITHWMPLPEPPKEGE